MRAFCILWTLLLVPVAMAADVAQPTSARPQDEMFLWYRQPAEKWLEAIPLGNGVMGAMVFGGPQQERIALNETTFWSGRPHDINLCRTRL